MHVRPAVCALFLLLNLALGSGARAGADKTPADQAPQLISTEGGGARWKNTKELRRWAAQGDPQACFELGTRMVFGDGEVAVDLTEAHALLSKAAEGGIADAHFRLGKLYHDGMGVARDYAKALEHYTAAARLGVPEAQHNIGAMLVSARGVKRNYIEGLAWLLVAEQGGADSDASQQVRARLARRPEDIRAAERRADEIRADLPHAVVHGDGPAGPPSPPVVTRPSTPATPPKVELPTVQPAITPPAIEPIAPPQITVPIDPSATRSP
ncbi:MAG: sel1 repeat family protein [Opitutaceae bacterium]|nr:sel1 repeat family protein [Opitutaceae bacterium]